MIIVTLDRDFGLCERRPGVLPGLRICENFSRMSSLKDRARRASLVDLNDALCPLKPCPVWGEEPVLSQLPEKEKKNC